ncbi:hypothetical protein ACIQV3_37840 [Streptomyces sp. NPDC099050]|uniref:hypothetical protein n=1 Tax=Streptomyces sp. NPDC099050 TaxID=3366100 RepID=UPI00380B54C7
MGNNCSPYYGCNHPTAWCSDFARWVWGRAGVEDTGTLTAAAISFNAYGRGVTHGTGGRRKSVLTSWYGPGGTERISVADATNPSAVHYRNAQLVALTADGGDYTAIRDGYANGVTWAGTRLYVASIGSSPDVFDTTRIWRTDSGTCVLVRRPIDPTTGVLKATAGVVQARDAYRSPIGGIQSVAMNNGRFVLSARARGSASAGEVNGT